MVERLQNAKGVTFTDLDGTLLMGNSMKVFMRKLPWMLLKRKSLGAGIASLWWMGCRLTRAVSHRKMKWHLTGIARRHLREEDWEMTAQCLMRKINPAVAEYMSAPARCRCEKYIATAAPEEYAIPLSRLLGYDGAVATHFSEDMEEYAEMRGIAKLEGIQNLIRERHLRLESFLTDHFDDTPTAREYPGLTILVNPTKKVQSIFHNIGVTRYLITK